MNKEYVVRNLIMPFLSLFLCLNLYAQGSLISNKDYFEYSMSLNLKTEEELLDVIQEIQAEIDEQTQVGAISSATALAASAVLSSIVYGVAFTGFSKFFPGGDTDVQKKMIIGTILAFVPNAFFSAVLQLQNSNSEFGLPFGTNLWTSIKSSISTLAYWISGSALTWTAATQLARLGTFNKYLDFKVYDGTFGPKEANLLGIAMIPINTWMMYSNIITRREQLEADVFDLQDRLDEARIELRNKKAAREARRDLVQRGAS